MRLDGDPTPAQKLDWLKRNAPESHRHLVGLINGLIRSIKLNGSTLEGPPAKKPQ